MFSSDNALCVGDHISWHTALDQADSSIQHMLLATDPQLKTIRSPLGYVNFVQVSTGERRGEGGTRWREREREREREICFLVQVVGVTVDELAAAQKWNGAGVLDLLTKHPL